MMIFIFFFCFSCKGEFVLLEIFSGIRADDFYVGLHRQQLHQMLNLDGDTLFREYRDVCRLHKEIFDFALRFGLKPVAGKVADADQLGGGLFSFSHLRAPSN